MGVRIVYDELYGMPDGIQTDIEFLELMLLNGHNEKANRYIREAIPYLKRAAAILSDAEFEITTSPREDDEGDDDIWADDEPEKMIDVPAREEIDAAIAALPEDKRKKYDELQAEFRALTAEENPDHERIAAVIRVGNELIGID